MDEDEKEDTSKRTRTRKRTRRTREMTSPCCNCQGCCWRRCRCRHRGCCSCSYCCLHGPCSVHAPALSGYIPIYVCRAVTFYIASSKCLHISTWNSEIAYMCDEESCWNSINFGELVCAAKALTFKNMQMLTVAMIEPSEHGRRRERQLYSIAAHRLTA